MLLTAPVYLSLCFFSMACLSVRRLLSTLTTSSMNVFLNRVDNPCDFFQDYRLPKKISISSEPAIN